MPTSQTGLFIIIVAGIAIGVILFAFILPWLTRRQGEEAKADPGVNQGRPRKGDAFDPAKLAFDAVEHAIRETEGQRAPSTPRQHTTIHPGRKRRPLPASLPAKDGRTFNKQANGTWVNADNSADVLSWAALFYLLSVEDQLAYGSEASPIVENFHVGPEHAANDTTTSIDSGGDGGD